MTNSKTRVRFVYVLPEVFHGDFLSEIKYLFIQPSGKYFTYINKCGHRNVLSTREVWMSIFHIINFLKKKKNHGYRGPGFF
jgi:hypothetical protein